MKRLRRAAVWRVTRLAVCGLVLHTISWPVFAQAQSVDSTAGVLSSVPQTTTDSARAAGYSRIPVAALAIGYLVPGAGHWYAGEPKRAAAVMGTAAVTVGAWVFMLRHNFGDCVMPDVSAERPCRSGRTSSTLGNVAVGVVLAGSLGVLAGLVDAPLAVRRQRKRFAKAYAARTQTKSMPNNRSTSASYAESCPSMSVVLHCSSTAMSGAIRFAAPRP